MALYEPFEITGSQYFITHAKFKWIKFEADSVTVEYEEGTVDTENVFHPAGVASLTIADTPAREEDGKNIPASTEYSELKNLVDINTIDGIIESTLKLKLEAL